MRPAHIGNLARAVPATPSIFEGGPFGPGVGFKGGSPFAAAGGFDVDPAAIRAGAAPLEDAAAANRSAGAAAADHAADATGAIAGAGRLGGLVEQLGAQLGTACEAFGGALAAAATTLEACAEGYEASDAPLTGAP